MLKFLIPSYYMFYSRLKSKLERISWFIIYVLPIYILGLFYTSTDYLLYSLFFILGLFIFNSIYETGHMENDIKTILNEKNPTLRLETKDYEMFEEKYFIIVGLVFLFNQSFLILLGIVLLSIL